MIAGSNVFVKLVSAKIKKVHFLNYYTVLFGE